MSQLRNLQLFRNDVFVFTESINSVELLKAYVTEHITLSDGEPIVIRYKETADGEIKGLFGTGYTNGEVRTILWTGEDINFNVTGDTESSDFVTINVTEDQDTPGSFKISAETNVATYGEDEAGLADVNYVEAALADLYRYEYQVKKTVNAETNANEYILQVKKSADGEWEDIDEMWSVNAELVVKSGDVVYRHLVADAEGREPGSEGYVETWSAPSTTKGENDTTFLRLVIQGQEDQPVYIPADALVDEYRAGNGIDVTNHEVSVKLGETDETHNVAFDFDENGNIVANVVINEDFVTTLVENEDFATSLGESPDFASSLSGNAAFASALGGNEGFATALGGSSAFASALGGNEDFATLINEKVDDAEVSYSENQLTVQSDGKFTQEVMDVIKGYIDNYNCGTFTL